MMRFYCCLSLFLISINQAYAFDIKPWFENINQRAARLLVEKKYADAEKTFTRPDWQAVAAYRRTNYTKASKQFKTLGGVLGLYNQGNALAYLGQYKEAIQAYDKALKINPKHQDAQYNRDLLKKLLEEDKSQSKQEQEQSKQEQEQSKQEQEQSKQEQEQSKQEQEQSKQEQEQSKQEQEQSKQ
ncbi:MAG: tetratricopeptide repeat protein, partial [Gammaproteobacteria bacterium]|nr:tetratricopeptide repeat protein [Gammaproteobacteria bacterium]